MQKLDDIQYYAAVYDELVAHLQRCLEEGTEIPVDIKEGVVPGDCILAVLSRLKGDRDKLIEKLVLADEVEVTGVGHKDFALS